MIILLYGKDTYRLQEKMKEIIAEYKKKHSSGLNLKFLGEKESLQNACDYDKQFSMFGEKRLLVAWNIFFTEKNRDDFLKEKKRFISSENIFLFYEEKDFKKSDQFLKTIEKEKEKEPKNVIIQKFSPLSGKSLFLWIKKEFEKEGVNIEEKAVNLLQKIGGEDLWKIKNEIEKISLYKKDISIEDVTFMSKIGVETNIFKTVDAIGEKEREKALFLFYDHLQKGDNPLYLFSMIVYQFRNLIVVSDLMRRNVSYEEMKQRSGLHPFVFKKTYHQVKKFSFSELQDIYSKLSLTDRKIKTGQIDPVLGIQLLLFSQ